jgi:hypothetical protein
MPETGTPATLQYIACLFIYTNVHPIKHLFKGNAQVPESQQGNMPKKGGFPVKRICKVDYLLEPASAE